MKTRKQNRRTRDCAADTKSSVWLSCARKELLPKEPWDSNTPCSELNCYPLVSLTKEQEQLRLILEAATTAPIQSPPMKSAGNWRIAGECMPSACWMMEDTVGTVPTRSESSTRKAAGRNPPASLAKLSDPRQSRGLISMSPSKGQVKSRLKAAYAPTACSAAPTVAPPAPGTECILERLLPPAPPSRRSSPVPRNSHP